MNRRDLFRTVGGVSLALTAGTLFDPRRILAAGQETSAIPPLRGGSPLPIFTALPYVQPGATSSRLPGAGGLETMVIAWQTDRRPADFVLTCGDAKVQIARTERYKVKADPFDGTFNYAATITGLLPGRTYTYQLRLGKDPVFSGTFAPRKGRGQKTRFVAFGDNSYGDIDDKMTAYQAYLAKPDFIMNTGDNVYSGGLDGEYARYFFPVYNAPVADARVGAPILRSTPFYTVLANHDVTGRDAQKRSGGDFDKSADSLAYYTNFYLPNNGIKAPSQPTPAFGADAAVDVFKQAAGTRYPSQANYSFDYGDAHFLCLDSNIYIDPNDSALQEWIKADLKGTDAAWKIVVYHHPAFNVGEEHYAEQHMRVLSPIFEDCGVRIVLNGHEHNYQRTRPIRFEPVDTKAATQGIHTEKRLVPGTFSVDSGFDGKTTTTPDGITYITTGAGGKDLYDTDWNRRPDLWRHAEDKNVDYVAAFVSDRHSISVFDMDARSLVLTQVDQWGRELDKVLFTRRG